MNRRERTRHLIELGGLVVKAGLVEHTEDDRATLYGAFRALAAKLASDERDQYIARWHHSGKRAFADEAETKAQIQAGSVKPGISIPDTLIRIRVATHAFARVTIV